MSIKGQYQSILKAVETYEKLLAGITEEEFLQSPPSGGWSYSETFSHIFQSNLLSLMSVDRCIHGTGIHVTKSIHPTVWAILFFGRFPPGKITAPARIAALVTRISREDARNMIVKFKHRLTELHPKVKAADKYQKAKHPRLGMLNARQWFRFIEVHTFHHIKQLKRIAKELRMLPVQPLIQPTP